MFAKRYFRIFAASILVMILSLTNITASNVGIFHVSIKEQMLDIFMIEEMDGAALSAKISNQDVEIVGKGLLANNPVTVRTTYLINHSKSIPYMTLGNIKYYLEESIKRMPQNEQYRIAVLGEETKVLQDFTSDRYDLLNALSSIKYTAKKSYIYDGIYQTIAEPDAADTTPYLYRTVVVTNDKDSGSKVTKEEIYLRLQAEKYPVDVVAISEKEMTGEYNDLAAIARRSNARYYNLFAVADAENLINKMTVNHLYWLRIKVPVEMLDGSNRNVKITDGNKSTEFNFKMKIFEGAVQTDPKASGQINKPHRTTDKTEDQKPAQQTPIEEPKEESPSLFQKYLPIILAISALIIAGLIFILFKKRKKPKEEVPMQEVISGSRTHLLGNDPSQRAYFILRNLQNPQQVWNVSPDSDILIGREQDCMICLEDRSVSRRQCRIYGEDAKVKVENLSNSNQTLINGKVPDAPVTLKEGDRIRCGRTILVVEGLDYAAADKKDLNKGTVYINI